MSIVEKAAARLRQSEQIGPAHARHHSKVNGQTAEALHDDSRVTPVERPQPKAPAEPIHIEEQALRRAGLAPPKSTASLIAREYQRIKRPLIASLATATARNRIMITSAMQGEGKTFTAMNLSLSLARERDHTVLLVDGDVIKPTVTRVLGLRERPGVMDLIGGQDITAEEAIVPTDIPGLSVLPAGRRGDQMAELLSSQRMAWLTDRLAAQPDRIVIFDSAPLLATTEAQALALNMGQILMVVKAGHTERRAIDAALSLIADPGIAISLVLNQSRKAHGDAYAGYYGMYYDGSEK